MSLLITGGSGFIGSTLTESLIEKGWNVIIADNRPLQRLEDDGRVTQIIGDLRKQHILEEALSYEPEGIIHLAAVSRVIDAEKDKKRCRQVNDFMTRSIIDKSLEMGIKPWLIYGSSREVYGEQEAIPVSESCNHRPINIYGVCKQRSEEYVRDYCVNESKGMVLRFSNVYGNEYDILDRVIPRFIINAMNGDKLTINGGSQIFDFTNIEDTLNGIVLAIDNVRRVNTRYFDHLHLLTGHGTTLQNLAAIVSENVGVDVDIDYEQARDYDVNRFIGNPTKANKVIGFKAKVSIEEGIRTTMSRYMEVGL